MSGETAVGQAKSVLDLGDQRCRVPIQPPEMQRSTAYAVGDIVRVRTSTAPRTIGIPFVDPGFEAGSLAGWSVVSGAAAAKTASGALGPKAGTRFLEGGNVASFELRQTVALAGLLDPATLAAGDYRLTVGGWRANGGGNSVDQGRLRVELLDEAGAVVVFGAGTAKPAGRRVSGVCSLNALRFGGRFSCGHDFLAGQENEKPAGGAGFWALLRDFWKVGGVFRAGPALFGCGGGFFRFIRRIFGCDRLFSPHFVDFGVH